MTPSVFFPRLTWQECPIWLRSLGVIALTNFATFIAGDLWLGGDAMNGGIRGVHYYLRSHGHVREVSAGVYQYSLVHGISAMAGMTAFVAAVAGFNYLRQSNRRG